MQARRPLIQALRPLTPMAIPPRQLMANTHRALRYPPDPRHPPVRDSTGAAHDDLPLTPVFSHGIGEVALYDRMPGSSADGKASRGSFRARVNKTSPAGLRSTETLPREQDLPLRSEVAGPVPLRRLW